MGAARRRAGWCDGGGRARRPASSRPEGPLPRHELNNLAALADTGRRDEAERAYGEALAAHRDLAARDPGVHRPDVALTLTNLGIL